MQRFAKCNRNHMVGLLLLGCVKRERLHANNGSLTVNKPSDYSISSLFSKHAPSPGQPDIKTNMSLFSPDSKLNIRFIEIERSGTWICQ